MALRVALFINDSGSNTYSQTDQINSVGTVHYTGQQKRKTFDNWFSPEQHTDFYLFYRNNSTFGWFFVGKAHSECQLRMRTDENPPVWELKLEEANKVSQENQTSDPDEANKVSQAFVSKEMVLKKFGLVSKYKSMATGIIPLHK